MSNFKSLEIYQLSFKLGLQIHKMTLSLPYYEMLEQGRQIRKSSKSIYTNIAEGYGRRNYKRDYIKHLVYAHASCDETIVHLKMIEQTHTVNDVTSLLSEYNRLGSKINKYIRYVKLNWNSSNLDNSKTGKN